MTPIAYRESRYAIDEQGSVINLANNKPLRPIRNSNGYLKASLANGDGTSEQVMIHRLVAEHFLPNPYKHPQVNHKDGDKSNNSVSNLEWCSAQQNASHALAMGLRPGYMSANEKDVLIARVYAGEKIRDLAIEVGRGEESLGGMLRRRANENGHAEEWKQYMKGRRSEITAIRNKNFRRSKGKTLP